MLDIIALVIFGAVILTTMILLFRPDKKSNEELIKSLQKHNEHLTKRNEELQKALLEAKPPA